MKHLTLSATKREEIGSNAIKGLRKSGKITAVIYGNSGTTPLTIDEKELKELLKEKGHSAALVNVKIEGKKTFLSDIADIQRDPVTDKLIHIDFHEVAQTEKMTTIIPLEFFGESIGVKNNGGILDIARHEVSVRCLPADLPSSIRVDISDLGINSIIHLNNLIVPAGVELIGDPETPVVSCKSVAEEEPATASAETIPEKSETEPAAEKAN